MYDVIIIGSGPVGLSLGVAARKRALDFLVLEKGVLVNSIFIGPTNGTFFSSARQLEIGGIPFISQGSKPTRQEICHYYRRVAEHNRLPIRFNQRVTGIEKKDDFFSVMIENGTVLYARNVVLATGFYDQPNRLGIPGENLPKVSHYYREPHLYFRQRVMVIGGRNSAVEAALEIYRAGGMVTVVHRGADFAPGVKYWLLPDIQNRIAEGSIQAFFSTRVKSMTPDACILVDHEGQEQRIENDSVLAMTGYHPDTTLLDRAGVHYDAQTLVPEIDEETLESNIKGLYIAGSPIAGRDCNRIFIENGRLHGEVIMQAIRPLTE